MQPGKGKAKGSQGTAGIKRDINFVCFDGATDKEIESLRKFLWKQRKQQWLIINKVPSIVKLKKDGSVERL